MSTTQVSIRLGVEGKADVKRAFDEVGKSGQDAFRGVASAMDATGAATDRQTQRLQRLAEAAKQAGAADQAQRSFNTVLGVDTAPKSARDSAAVFEESAKGAEDLAARTAALRAQINPLGVAQQKMNAEIANAGGLLKVGAITQAEHTAAVALANSRYKEAATAIEKYGANAGLTANQVLILGSAARHTVDAVIAGQNPMRALTIEGVKASAALGEGGIGGLL